MAKNTERFSDRVENYVKYRPGYPVDLLPYLKKTVGFDHKWIVADIGSGTGISAELFLKNDNAVYAVEPNKEMREAAERLLEKYNKFRSIDGTSESTTLSAGSIDLIVAAQAFHWFDRDRFKTECRRIAKEGAYCLLIWNERKVSSPFEIAYEDLLMKYGNDYLKVDHRNIKPENIKAFFDPNPVTSQTFYNEQLFDFEGVKGRLLSSSYAPNVGEPNYEPMCDYLRVIFDRYQKNGKIAVSYDCNLYLGKI